MSDAEHNATTARVGRNSAWLLGGEVAGRALGAIWQILLARYLGTLVFGEFTFALTLTAMIGILSDFGLGTLVTREVARHREEPFRVLRGALIARALLAALLGILAVVSVSLADRPVRVVELLAILVAGQLVMGQGELLAAAHRGREHVRRPVLVSLLYRVSLVGTGISAMALGASAQVLAGLVAFFALFLLFLFRGLPRAGAPEAALTLLRRAAPIGIGLVLWTIYFRSNIILVSLLCGDEEAGVFAAPFRLVEAVLLLSGPMIAAAFPVLARHSPEEPAFCEVFRGMQRTLIFLGTPLAVLFMFEGENLLTLLLGPEYRSGTRTLLLLAGIIPISFVAGPFLASLIARNRGRVYLGIMGVAVVVNLVIAVALIPRFGARGAAMAMLTTEAIVLCLSLSQARLPAEVGRAVMLLASAATAAASTMGVLLWLRVAGLSFPVRAPIALLLVYPVLATVFGVISPARILLFLRTLFGRE